MFKKNQKPNELVRGALDALAQIGVEKEKKEKVILVVQHRYIRFGHQVNEQCDASRRRRMNWPSASAA